MSEPQRYTQLPVCVEPSYQAQEVVSPMAKTVKGGEWVKWEDYAKLKAEVERLRKAGDAMEIALQVDFNGCPYEPLVIMKAIHRWRTAKDGKPSAK